MVAAVVAGVIALFAPCCVSVMLPAYLATSFQNRRAQVAMTFIYAAGVATVVLPLALGAVFLRRVLFGQHTVVFALAGALLVGLGAYTLGGGRLRLPMPGSRTPAAAGPAGIYSLGVVSGLATSCCAPVLAGVVALSGLASSFLAALGLGAAYVFGMVAPLFALAVAWKRLEDRARRLFQPRSVTLGVGRLRRSISGTALVSGLLLLAMGAWTLWMAARGESMAAATGWQARLTAELGHWGHDLSRALSVVPGWVAAVVLVGVVAVLGRQALRELGWAGTERPHGGADGPVGPVAPGAGSRIGEEEVSEHTHV